ncbi:hypothetical protein GCM10020000_81290 [Streptomyces olivoverticillatus]
MGSPRAESELGLTVALLALSGLATGTTATAAEHRAAAPSGDYCATKGSFYGSGQYTYAEAQVCLRFGPSSNAVVVKDSNSQYYYGGSWYSASSSYPANWTASGTLSKSGQSGNYSVPPRSSRLPSTVRAAAAHPLSSTAAARTASP